ncbi:MAG: hypothetical protein C0600_10365 [Ignavibacteria bacterium]|nr:MAG: hypothetical protein C0600_10365 [Ignavibacteria bacterium]
MNHVRLTVLVFLFTALLASTLSAQEKDDNAAVGAVGPLKFSGLMFGDVYYYMDAMDEDNEDMNGLQFRRIYITTDYTINETFSTRFRLEANDGVLNSSGKFGVLVKDAYLKWKNLFSGSDLILGISPTPSISAADAAWGYRALEKTLLDKNKIVSSRDVGIDLKGKVGDGSLVKYWLKLGNNSGNSPEGNKFKRVYGMVQLNPASNLNIYLSADYAGMPEVSDSVTSTMKGNGALVASGVLHYKSGSDFSVGAEGFYKSHANNFYAGAGESLSDQSGFGLSVFTWIRLMDGVKLVGRYDTYDPNMDSGVENDVRSLILAAVDFTAANNVNIMPGIEVLGREGADNSDVIPRVTFFWKF